eukprot:TRINITY_DN1314_c0_g1_i1.p1 TRINITY_DN1314_c0_g1~~TRINITY_DN1314_c0_g1_i1.p1  ORF type:complete len:108 (+),score=34.46 TRINITY_DN1314_c0_g1_i1:35-325(+)
MAFSSKVWTYLLLIAMMVVMIMAVSIPVSNNNNIDTPLAEGECNDETTQESCLSTQQNNTNCEWCKSAAVPSACYSASQAARLPPSIFSCSNTTAL